MRPALSLAVLCVALAACGHTTIVTNDKGARIYADGQYLGRGEAKYGGRTGPPRTMKIAVKAPGATVEREVKRQFTVTTFLLGLVSVYTGWLWGWQYPENVIVLVPTQPEGGGGWDDARSVWDQPPAGWGGEAAPAAKGTE